MKNVKKILLGFTLISLLVVPAIGLAQAENAPTVNVIDALGRIADWFFTILLIVAAIFLIVAAFNFITASGDAEKIKTARDQVMYALMGVAVALLARGLIVLVKTILAP